MNKLIKVGNIDNAANHIRINDSSVSREHLEVRRINNNILRIIDLGSTNGTFIDGIEIVESDFKRHQTIKIGYQSFSGEEFFKKVERFFIDPKVRWVEEFVALKKDFKRFEKDRQKINDKQQLKINLIRGTLVIAILLLFIFGGNALGIPGDFRIVLSIGGGIIAGLIAPKLVSCENFNTQSIALKKVYSNILCCPRCKRDLSHAPYEIWLQERRCSVCDAVWVE